VPISTGWVVVPHGSCVVVTTWLRMGSMTTSDRGVQNPPLDGWARRRERVSRHIERCALELIASKGPDSVTVEAMADAAGVSERTFFRYFRTRDDVMSAFPNRGNRALAARVVARPASESVLEAFMGALREAQEAPAHGQGSPVDEDWPIDQDWLLLWGKARQNWPLDSPAPYMIATFAEAIAERLGVPVGDPEVGIMATVISNVTWAAFRRWLQGGAAETFNVVVEDSFAALHRLIEHVGKPVEEPSRRQRS